MQYRRILLQQFPGVPIVGRNFPPSADKVLIATIGSYAFFLGMGVIFFGDYLLKLMGIVHPPAWYNSLKENKMQACMFLWIGNMYCSSMMQTGAFEVSFDGVPVFSKLQTGHLPEAEDIVRSLMAKGAGKAARMLQNP